jgi:hypothetical protein
MIFAKKKKILVWCDDPPEDRVISIVAGCLANHDRAHSLHTPTHTPKMNMYTPHLVKPKKKNDYKSSLFKGDV